MGYLTLGLVKNSQKIPVGSALVNHQFDVGYEIHRNIAPHMKMLLSDTQIAILMAGPPADNVTYDDDGDGNGNEVVFCPRIKNELSY